MERENKAPPRAANARAANAKSDGEGGTLLRSGRLVHTRLTVAITMIRALGGQHDDHPRGCELCRLRHEADEAFAAQLLPSILGGEWEVAARQYFPGELEVAHSDFGAPLFDHRRLFRRRGMRGGNTLANSVLIGHPYQLDDEALDQAARLSARGIGVWTHDDLSSWYPGWTRLVIASPRLMTLAPSDYGFGRLV